MHDCMKNITNKSNYRFITRLAVSQATNQILSEMFKMLLNILKFLYLTQNQKYLGTFSFKYHQIQYIIQPFMGTNG